MSSYHRTNSGNSRWNSNGTWIFGGEETSEKASESYLFKAIFGIKWKFTDGKRDSRVNCIRSPEFFLPFALFRFEQRSHSQLIYKQTQGKTYCNTIKHTYNSKTITISKGVWYASSSSTSLLCGPSVLMTSISRITVFLIVWLEVLMIFAA